MGAHLKAMVRLGVPYSEDDVAKANEDILIQADPMASTTDLETRYPKVQVRDFDGDPDKLTEMDALIAYLQMLGTLVDFESGEAQEQPR